jgi:hypothetical protein
MCQIAMKGGCQTDNSVIQTQAPAAKHTPKGNALGENGTKRPGHLCIAGALPTPPLLAVLTTRTPVRADRNIGEHKVYAACCEVFGVRNNVGDLKPLPLLLF